MILTDDDDYSDIYDGYSLASNKDYLWRSFRADGYAGQNASDFRGLKISGSAWLECYIYAIHMKIYIYIYEQKRVREQNA